MSRVREIDVMSVRGTVATGNSTVNPLGVGATFTGAPVDITDAAIIYISTFSDAASATDGLEIQQSSDGVNWDHKDNFTIPAGKAKTFSINPACQYLRVVYTNGAVGQTTFRLQTILKAVYGKPSSHRISDDIATDDDAELVKAVVAGESLLDGRFRNVEVTPRHEASVSIGTFGDSTAVDAFGRLRVSNPSSIFENMMQYGLNPLSMVTNLTGSGSVTHLPNESAAQLSTGGTASGDKAIFQTKRYHRYQAGKSQQILMTATLGAPKANVRQRIGYFDAANGMFFEQTAAGKFVVIRSSTSGSPVDAPVAQANWNLDKMDGTGISKVTIDWSKAQIFIIDYQWLGVGRVRFGFDIDGQIVYCHEALHSNIVTTVYTTTPHLPMRVEIENTGVAASTTTLKQFCMVVSVEGGRPEEPGLPFAIGRGVTSLGVTTRRPVLSIRPKATFGGITNRGHLVFSAMELIASTNNCLFELVRGGTLTGASWADVNSTYSMVEYDTSATAITGDISIDRGWALSGLGASPLATQDLSTPIELFNDFAGTTPEILTIVCTAFTGTANINALMRWTEQR